jgi:hypothetical protein
MKDSTLFSESNAATYCPEDDKIRLYVGRVPRDEYEALRAEGWTSTPKQSEAGQGEFAAVWTVEREETAISYAGIIGDEDTGPAERAADRAERFGGYLGKRLGEATGHADGYEGEDTAHGFQNAQRAERAASRHDRKAERAINCWDKAEYWHQRTAGVISHALHVAAPGVRMGRIKKLESELRKAEKVAKDYAVMFAKWKSVEAMEDAPSRAAAVRYLAGSSISWNNYTHPRPEECENPYTKEHGGSLYTLLTLDKGAIGTDEALKMWLDSHPAPEDRTECGEARYKRHIELRLAYERQMLEAQGGRLESKDIEPGGKIGGKLILKASKSNATGRVTSCALLGPKVGEGWHYRVYNIPGTEWAEYTVKTERLAPGAYTPPTPETLAELETVRATIKAARVEAVPKAPPTINPTKAEAEKLQAIWNTDKNKFDAEEKTVHEMTQAEYSANSKGSYCACEIVSLQPGGRIYRERYITRHAQLAPVAKVREHSGRVVVLTDKPQKAFPPEVLRDPLPAIKARVLARLPELVKIAARDWMTKPTKEEDQLFEDARLVGLAFSNSRSQFGLTAECQEAARAAGCYGVTA